jgi:hypothetical protein
MSVVVRWAARDPGPLGGRLADQLRLPRPDPDATPVAFILDGGILVLERADAGAPERLTSVETLGDAPGEVAREATAEAIAAIPSRIGLLAVGWATVDLDRAAAEILGRHDLRGARGREAADDGWLGARTRVLEPGYGSGASGHLASAGPAVVLLEPATEGRVAAALARWGEGPVAVYVSVPGPAGRATRPGPFGSAELLHARRPWGPFVLAIARGPDRPGGPPAGTIGA